MASRRSRRMHGFTTRRDPWKITGVVAILVMVMLLAWASKVALSREAPDSSGPAFAAAAPAAPPEDVVTVAFVGDSYTAGSGASAKATRWTSLLSRDMRWNEVNLGRGGTGYFTVNPPETCVFDQCPDYPQMIDEVVTANPGIVVVAGGQNDIREFEANPDAVIGAVDATYRSLREQLPEVGIIAVGPSVPGEVTQAVRDLDQAVQRAAAAVGAGYVSLIEPPVLRPELVSADGTHANDAGHAAIAQSVLGVIRSR